MGCFGWGCLLLFLVVCRWICDLLGSFGVCVVFCLSVVFCFGVLIGWFVYFV